MLSEKKLKILYVITKGNWGGAQKYVFDMATSISQEHVQVSVACGDGDVLPKKLTDANIPVITIPRLGRDISLFNDIGVFFNLIKLFKKEKPDVVHLNSSKIGGLGALAARIAGIKKIFFTVHGFAFNEHRPWIQKKIIVFLSWLTVIFSTDVIFVSTTEHEQAQHWPGIKHKAHLVYNGIRFPELFSKQTAREKLATILGISSSLFLNTTIIGTVAELTGNKNLTTAIQAIEHIPHCIYIIIGKGEEHDSLISLIREKGLEHKVFLAGFVTDSAQYLQAFDIFVLPSQKEGMPYVLLEAGYAQVPVVATRVGGIPEIIANDVGTLVPAKNAHELRQALESYIHKPEYAALHAQNLHKHVIETFNLGITIEKTLALYRRDTI